jgi:hypothetical protein
MLKLLVRFTVGNVRTAGWPSFYQSSLLHDVIAFKTHIVVFEVIKAAWSGKLATIVLEEYSVSVFCVEKLHYIAGRHNQED